MWHPILLVSWDEANTVMIMITNCICSVGQPTLPHPSHGPSSRNDGYQERVRKAYLRILGRGTQQRYNRGSLTSAICLHLSLMWPPDTEVRYFSLLVRLRNESLPTALVPGGPGRTGRDKGARCNPHCQTDLTSFWECWITKLP